MQDFNLRSDLQPTGDQPQAIAKLAAGLQEGIGGQTLLGVTGSGKTFTMAHVIARVQRPTLVIAPNKTLAAQLYGEFKSYFPENAVEYFVSYYDYYQPEAYVPKTDTYIAKDASINETIDKMRHSATRSVLERRDVIVVASVSCIYGLGSPETYREMLLQLRVNMEIAREQVLRKLVEIQYQRNDDDFHRGTFRVRGDVLEIFPSHEEDRAIRVEFFGDEIDSIKEIDPLTGQGPASPGERRHLSRHPLCHHPREPRPRHQGHPDRALAELSRNSTGRGNWSKPNAWMNAPAWISKCSWSWVIAPASRTIRAISMDENPVKPPATLIDYFPEDWLLFIDESHITVPQLRGMYRGRSRAQGNPGALWLQAAVGAGQPPALLR